METTPEEPGLLKRPPYWFCGGLHLLYFSLLWIAFGVGEMDWYSWFSEFFFFSFA